MEETKNNVIQVGAEITPNAPITKKESQVPVKLNENNIANINLLNPTDVAAAETFIKRIMRSSKGGVTSIEDGLAMIMRAQDLNIKFSTALEHVHVINGKTGVDIHIIKALLSKAGVTWGKPIKDYAPLYEYTDGFNVYVDGSFPDYAVRCKNAVEAKQLAEKNKEEDKIYLYPVRYYKDFNGNTYKDYQLNGNFVVVNNKEGIQKATAEKKIPIIRVPNVPVDYVTEYELTRIVNGKEVKCIGKFSYSEALAAGMFEKDTYKKYPKILIGHRAFTYAARDIASDIILGAYETTELKIMTGVDIEDKDYVDISSTV